MISFATAPEFDSISHPPDFTVRQGDTSSITWEWTISSVTTPTYYVYRNGVEIIPGWTWTFDGFGGSITVDVQTGNLGLFNYTIVVKDGAGHEITDEVFVTVEEKSGFLKWWTDQSGWVYVVFGIALLGFMTAMVLIRQRGFKKSESMIP